MLADMSQTERIRFIRNRTLAIWKRSATISRPEQGPGGTGTDESTRSARALGQRTYSRQHPGASYGGLPTVTEIPPCCN